MLLTNQFLAPLSLSTLTLSPPKPRTRLTVVAAKTLNGVVITNVNDKTVNVRTVYQRIIPKYLKRKRFVRKFQAHDPENQFKVGDLVTLEKCRPISKTKHHLAVPYKDPHGPRNGEKEEGELGLPLESAE